MCIFHCSPSRDGNKQTDARNFRDVLRPQKNDDVRSGFARYSEIIKNMVRRTEADLLEFKFECPIIQLHGALRLTGPFSVPFCVCTHKTAQN
jgi:hypothetical protein